MKCVNCEKEVLFGWVIQSNMPFDKQKFFICPKCMDKVVLE